MKQPSNTKERNQLVFGSEWSHKLGGEKQSIKGGERKDKNFHRSKEHSLRQHFERNQTCKVKFPECRVWGVGKKSSTIPDQEWRGKIASIGGEKTTTGTSLRQGSRNRKELIR